MRLPKKENRGFGDGEAGAKRWELDEVGTLEAGKKADVVLVETSLL